jgi:hypothetical protein
MVAEAWAVGNTTCPLVWGNEAVWRAYGAQQPGHDQAWTQPKQSAQRCPLQSLFISLLRFPKQDLQGSRPA